MRFFLWEYFCSGAFTGPSAATLLREGRSMLEAVLEDACGLPECRVETILSADACAASLDPAEASNADEDPSLNKRVHVASDPEQERRLFAQLAAECDATFVIAPETAGVLCERRTMVDAAGGRFVGCSSEALALCSDKLQIAEHLRERGIPTIETHRLEKTGELRFPAVVKPRDGAGSQRTYLVRDEAGLDEARAAFSEAAESEPVWQPHVPGTACSMAAVVSEEGDRVEPFPLCEQRLSRDGRFRYEGGRVPLHSAEQRDARACVRRACRAIPGLYGYVGIDLILPEEDRQPVIVEINPRLTTSYLGYRALASGNLAARVLFPDHDLPDVDWRDGGVRFSTDGRLWYRG